MSVLTVLLQGRGVWSSHRKHFSSWSERTGARDCGAESESHKHQKRKVTEARAMTNKALEFTRPVPPQQAFPEASGCPGCYTSGSSNTPWFDSSLFPPSNIGTLLGVCLLAGWCHWIWELRSAHKPTSQGAPIRGSPEAFDFRGLIQPGFFRMACLPPTTFGVTFFASPELRLLLVSSCW